MTPTNRQDIDLWRVFAAIDVANARDPAREVVDGIERPAAVVYGERMSSRLQEFAPAASPALRIAARGQHIERWTVSRKSYPEGRIGYLTWRKELQRFHARRLGEIISERGLAADFAERVGQLVRKESLSSDNEAQVLEDVACLVFLEHYFDPFAEQQTDEKLATILAKTWRKMSQRARDVVQASALPQRVIELLQRGLEMRASRT